MKKIIANTLKQKVLDGTKLISELGLTPMTQGNISLRDPESGLIIMTPHDYPYAIMTVDDLMILDSDGKILEGKHDPSAETPVHCHVYKTRPEIHGIVHTEPVWVNIFGIANKPIEPVFVNMAIDAKTTVPIMPFANSGSQEFAVDMLKVMGDSYAVVWANHGMLAIGENLDKAIHCTVMVEANAQMYYHALQLGNVHTIPQDVIDSLIG